MWAVATFRDSPTLCSGGSDGVGGGSRQLKASSSLGGPEAHFGPATARAISAGRDLRGRVLPVAQHQPSLRPQDDDWSRRYASPDSPITFSVQNSVLVLESVWCSGQPCQKHPSTKIAIFNTRKHDVGSSSERGDRSSIHVEVASPGGHEASGPEFQLWGGPITSAVRRHAAPRTSSRGRPRGSLLDHMFDISGVSPLDFD